MRFAAIDTSPGIYAIRHVASGKVYVGSSVNMRKRVYEHARLLGLGRHKNAHLQAAFAKYGADAFEASIIERVADVADLYRVEQAHLDRLRSFDPAIGYNRASDTTAPQRGLKRSAETRAKIGATKVGHKFRLGMSPSEETRQKIAEKLRGRKASAETLEKLSAFQKGRKKSPEWCAKMSEIQKGRVITQEQRDRISATLLQRFAGPKQPKPVKKIGRPPGIPMSPEEKERLRALHAGRPLSKEHRDRIGAANRARHIAKTAAKETSSWA
jgi:group I intron endonuclease